jgi:hypothetical protein
MQEDRDEHMVGFSWIVGGSSNMEMHAYTEGDEPNDPTISVIMADTGEWTFKFKKIAGSGRIQVTKGCDYNPIDLIESLYHHILKLPKTPATPNNRKPAGIIEFDPNTAFSDKVRDEWQ